MGHIIPAMSQQLSNLFPGLIGAPPLLDAFLIPLRSDARVLGQWPVVCQESLKVLDRLVGQTVVGNEQLMPAGCITQMESEPVQKSGTAPPESGKSVSPPHISLPGFEAALPVVAVEFVQMEQKVFILF